MKRILLYLTIAALPFLCVIVVNESTKKEPHYIIIKPGNTRAYALNSSIKIPDYCTWDCHNNGCSHRKSNVINTGRVKLLYEAIIDANGVHEKQKGKYVGLTLLTLVVIWPLLMFALVIGNIELYRKRKNAGNAH